MFIMTANGWRPLWTLSEPVAEPVGAYPELMGIYRDGSDKAIFDARAKLEADNTQALRRARQQRVDRGLI